MVKHCQDNFITFAHNTLMTDLARQVAKANQGGLTYLEAQVSQITRKTESITKAIDDI